MQASPSQLSNPRILFTVTCMAFALWLIAQRHWSQPEFPVTTISASTAKSLIDQNALVIDVRSPDAYDAKHIPSAINIPLDTLRDGIPTTIANATAKPIVVYCGDGARTGPKATALLNQAGFSKAVNLKSGIQGWTDAGLPLTK